MGIFFFNIPKAIFYLLKEGYRAVRLLELRVRAGDVRFQDGIGFGKCLSA